MADWTNYNKVIESSKPEMLIAMKDLARQVGLKGSDVYDDDLDDFQVGFVVERPDGNKLDVSFSIWDSGDADDGVYGEHGNFHFSMVEEGGLIVSSFSPYNYSPECWVDYTDTEEWKTRLHGIADSIVTGEVKNVIETWLTKTSDKVDNPE